MIKINRNLVNCPSRLNTSNRNLVKGDYSHPEVKMALSRIQHFKCCYCEKDLKKLGSTEKWVDHFVARTNDRFKNARGKTKWNEANAWENLLYACGTCNRSKGTTSPFYSNNRRKLIDPSYCRIDPENHIEFSIDGSAISYRGRTVLGKRTIKNLKLEINERHDIYQALRNLQRDIDNLFSEYVDELSAGDQLEANSKLIDLGRMTSAHKPHTSFCRKYIIQQVNKFNSIGLRALRQRLGRQIQPITVDVAKGYEVIE